MIARIITSTLLGIDAHPVTVEVDIKKGLPAYTTVGLPDAAIKESRERVRSAIKNCGFHYPDQVITVSLAPADIRKEGSQLDCAIALGILVASKQLSPLPENILVAGELSLAGDMRAIRGALSISVMASETGMTALFLPEENASEAAVMESVRVFPVHNLRHLGAHFNGLESIDPVHPTYNHDELHTIANYSEVKGQWQAKRALEISAAGGHNLLMSGPPGTGKSLLAMRLPGILPTMSRTESIETTRIHSVAGILPAYGQLIMNRPFRSPHHTISYAGLTGGGNTPRPGEITLAHHGVLFLDEITEFRRSTLESLRQPMENGQVTISRANRSLTFPARFMLVAAMNPCPCGYQGHPKRSCQCTPMQIQRYRSRISGPLLDRIDLKVEVPALSYDDFSSRGNEESSEDILDRVKKARDIQNNRFQGSDRVNSSLSPSEIEEYCKFDDNVDQLLRKSMDHYGLSGRSIHRVLKVSRTIADLSGCRSIKTEHVSEALQFRIHRTGDDQY